MIDWRTERNQNTQIHTKTNQWDSLGGNMAKYDWMGKRIGEMENMTRDLMDARNIPKTTGYDFTMDSIQGEYLDWAYGCNSKRFNRHFENLLDIRTDRMGNHHGQNK